MEGTILEVVERTNKHGKFNEKGFLPGVLYGDGFDEAVSVKFNEFAVNKLVNRHGSNAKVWVMYNNSKKYGIIKEVQRHPVTRNIIHVDIQTVSMDQEIKMQVPIIYRGEESLKNRQLLLQVNRSDITVTGKAAHIPNSIYIDVSDKELGDTITINDFVLDEELEVNENDNEVYASIIKLKSVDTASTDDDADSSDEDAPIDEAAGTETE